MNKSLHYQYKLNNTEVEKVLSTVPLCFPTIIYIHHRLSPVGELSHYDHLKAKHIQHQHLWYETADNI